MSESRVPRNEKIEAKARLRRRLKAGAFTALLALGWATTQPTAAQAAPAPGVLEKRVETVRDALGLGEAATLSAGTAINPWFNAWWNNWSNGWNNWNNAWHNWNNGWHNWSNGWSNGWNNVGWNNWSNTWHNV